nr:LysR substrate-binding domain-containing protein [Ramlibacter agri]
MRHLRYFVAVAEELSFTRAAQRLHIAQPPLSTQIRALEEELKAPLFERDKRRIHLTPAGQHLLDKARAILAAVDEARHETRHAASGEVGRIHLGYTASAMLSPVLPAVLRRFAAAHPSVRLMLQERTSLDQLDAVHARTLDIGVLRKPEATTPPGVVLEQWLESPLVAAVPADSPLAAKRALRIADLRDHPLIAYPKDSGIGLYWKVQALCTQAGFRPQVVQEARDTGTIVGLVAAGIGIAIVPRDTRCFALPGVAYQRILDQDATSSLHLAWREAGDNPHAQRLLRDLRAARKAGA